MQTCKEFFDDYHDYYLCQHCGRTYNDPTDGRVTKVYRAMKLANNIQSVKHPKMNSPSLPKIKGLGGSLHSNKKSLNDGKYSDKDFATAKDSELILEEADEEEFKSYQNMNTEENKSFDKIE